MAADTTMGTITHYYTHLGVGIVKLARQLAVGERVRFSGHTTDFEQVVEEMQFDHKPIEKGTKGQEVGIKVEQHVREGDRVVLVG